MFLGGVVTSHSSTQGLYQCVLCCVRFSRLHHDPKICNPNCPRENYLMKMGVAYFLHSTYIEWHANQEF